MGSGRGSRDPRWRRLPQGTRGPVWQPRRRWVSFRMARCASRELRSRGTAWPSERALDKRDSRRTAGGRLEPQSSRAGVEVENAGASKRVASFERGEDRFAHSVAGRARARAGNREAERSGVSGDYACHDAKVPSEGGLASRPEARERSRWAHGRCAHEALRPRNGGRPAHPLSAAVCASR